MRAVFRHIGLILLGATALPTAASAQLWGNRLGYEWSVANLTCDAACKAALPENLKFSKRKLAHDQSNGSIGIYLGDIAHGRSHAPMIKLR